MKRALGLLFFAGALVMAPPSQHGATPQSNTQSAGNPQPQATNQASSHDRHHHRHSSTSGNGRRHHRHHKASAKHWFKSIALKPRRGAWRLPLLLICCVVSEARKMHVCFASDTHRKSGAISFGAALSPVESYSLRSSMSSRFACTPGIRRMQAKNWW